MISKVSVVLYGFPSHPMQDLSFSMGFGSCSLKVECISLWCDSAAALCTGFPFLTMLMCIQLTQYTGNSTAFERLSKWAVASWSKIGKQLYLSEYCSSKTGDIWEQSLGLGYDGDNSKGVYKVCLFRVSAKVKLVHGAPWVIFILSLVLESVRAILHVEGRCLEATTSHGVSLLLDSEVLVIFINRDLCRKCRTKEDKDCLQQLENQVYVISKHCWL